MNYMGIERDLFSHPRIYGIGGEGFCVLVALGSLASREWRADGRVARDLSSAEAIAIACAGADVGFVRRGLAKLIERQAVSGSETEGWRLHADIWRRIAGQAILDRHRKQHSEDSPDSADSEHSGESATSDSPTVRPSGSSSLPSEAQKKDRRRVAAGPPTAPATASAEKPASRTVGNPGVQACVDAFRSVKPGWSPTAKDVGCLVMLLKEETPDIIARWITSYLPNTCTTDDAYKNKGFGVETLIVNKRAYQAADLERNGKFR